MSPQEEINDLRRRIEEMERATRYYPPMYPPGYTPPPTAPYHYPPWPGTYPWSWPNGIFYCSVSH